MSEFRRILRVAEREAMNGERADLSSGESGLRPYLFNTNRLPVRM